MGNRLFRCMLNIFLVVFSVQFFLPASLQGCFSVCSGRKKKKSSQVRPGTPQARNRPGTSQAHNRQDKPSLNSLRQIRTAGGGIHEQQEDTSEMSARTVSSQMYRTTSFISQSEVRSSTVVTSLSHTESDDGGDGSDYGGPLLAKDFINALKQVDYEVVEKCMEHYELSPLGEEVESVLICALETDRIDIIHRIFLCNIEAGKRCYVGSNHNLLPRLIQELHKRTENDEKDSEDFAVLVKVFELCRSDDSSPVPDVHQSGCIKASTGRNDKTARGGRWALISRAVS